MGLLMSIARYGGCDLKSAGQAHSLYSRCLGYALPMVLSTNFPCSQWALIPNEGDGNIKLSGVTNSLTKEKDGVGRYQISDLKIRNN